MEIYLRYSCCKCCWCCCPCSLSVAAAARKAPYDFIALVLQGYKWILPATTTARRCSVSVRQSTRAKGYVQLVILLLFACGGGKSGSHRHAGRMVIVVIVKSIKCNYGDHDMQQLWHDTRRSGAWFGDFSRGGGRQYISSRHDMFLCSSSGWCCCCSDYHHHRNGAQSLETVTFTSEQRFIVFCFLQLFLLLLLLPRPDGISWAICLAVDTMTCVI